MVSRLKKAKWFQTEQVSPKCPEDSLPLDESAENSTESVISYIYSENSENSDVSRVSITGFLSLATQEEQLLGRTSQLPNMKSAASLRTSIQLYKVKSANRIQSFFRLKKIHKRCKAFNSRCSKTSKMFLIRKAFWKLKNWVKLTCKAAKLIQRWWRQTRIHTSRVQRSPKKNLLKRAVSIGTKLIKIQKFIEKVVRSRPSTPSSPNREAFEEFSRPKPLRSNSSLITLHASICTESETLETHTNTPSASVCERIGNISIDSSPDVFRTSFSLVMKKAFKIRTKKKRTLKMEELNKQLEFDEENFRKWESFGEDSRIPRLSAESLFFFGSLGKKKQSLDCEYEELIKG